MQSDDALYACLQPCNSQGQLSRFDLVKPRTSYSVGRNLECDFHLDGATISFAHSIITWNGGDGDDALVCIQDCSTNGTWINGHRLQKGHTCILRDGNEVAFGTPVEQPDSNEDHRYIFRLFTGRAAYGLNAEYDLTGELGHGSFATVMKALHRPTGGWFAVKIIHRSKIHGDARAQEQSLSREVSILESINHKNICSLHEHFYDESDGYGNIYLVLEYMEGGDLLDLITERQGLCEREAISITKQVCEAMAYIHGRGIVHRDLKPENILLSRDKSVAKVADFGLAKVVDEQTLLRTMCGTPSYLAPEVVDPTGDRGYDHLVDSWSVGVIVYSMLANCTPFIEDTSLPVMQRIAQRSVDWDYFKTSCPRVGKEARNFIERLLDKNPQTRMLLTDALRHPWLSGQASLSASSPRRRQINDYAHPAQYSRQAHGQMPRLLERRADVNTRIKVQEAIRGMSTSHPATQAIALQERKPPVSPPKKRKRRNEVEIPGSTADKKRARLRQDNTSPVKHPNTRGAVARAQKVRRSPRLAQAPLKV